MSTSQMRRTLLVLSSLLLAAALLALGLFLLSNSASQVHAQIPGPVYSVEFGVLKRPGISTVFVVTNTGSAPATMSHSYYSFSDLTTPIHVITNIILGPGASGTYTVGDVHELPTYFYGWLKITSNQSLEAKVVSPHKLIRGSVLRGTHPVTDARVIALRDGGPDRIEARVDMSGTYRIPVDGGRWLLNVAPARGVTSTDWIYADPPQAVEFTKPPAEPEVKTVNFQVTMATGHLIGHVCLPLPGDGTLAGLPVRIIARDSTGIGNETWTNPAGDFGLQVPEGVYNVFVRPLMPRLAGPSFHGVLITTSTDIGNIYLITTTVLITGQVTDAAGHSLDYPDMGAVGPARVIAWERHGAGWGAVDTDPQGYYTLPLAVGPIPSDWMMRVVPPPVAPGKHPLVPPRARRIILRAGMRREVNFRLLPADGHIIGQVVDAVTKSHLNLLGRAHALRRPRDQWPRHFRAPMYNGYFTLTVPTTHTYNMIYDVGVRPDPVSGYAPGYVRNVDPPTSGDIAITVPLHLRDALIVGALVDATRLPTVTHIVTCLLYTSPSPRD